MHTTFRGMRATLRARPTRVKAGDDTLPPLGEVSEWSKERDWKSRTCCKVRRGFKSRPLRFPSRSPQPRQCARLRSPGSGLTARERRLELVERVGAGARYSRR